MVNGWLARLIDRYALPIYFAATFFISWGAVLIVSGVDGLPVKPEQAVPMGMALLLGPSIAGIVLTAIGTGMQGLRDLAGRLTKWRVSFHWYLFALLLAPVSTFLLLLLLSQFSGVFTPRLLQVDGVVAQILMALVAGLMVGTLEELGWTGFAVHRMRREHSVVVTGLVIGLAWGAWHFIVFWEAGSFSEPLLLAILLARLFSWLPPYRILMAWLYERTESLALAILMHASLVASLMVAEPILTGEALLILIIAKGVVLWLMVAAWLMYGQSKQG